MKEELTFWKLLKEFGLIFVLRLYLFKKVTINEWVKICDDAHSKSTRSTLSLQKISEYNLTYAEWLTFYYKVHIASPLATLCLQKMSETAQSFNEWNHLYVLVILNRHLELFHFKKCLSLKSNFKQISLPQGNRGERNES